MRSAVTSTLREVGEFPRGRLGRGSVHHVAFRAADDAAQAAMAEKAVALGLHVTEQKDRNYFRSVYFREPGGVLFEIATDDPGFAVDEPAESLGRALKLPRFLEPRRAELEAKLPPLESRWRDDGSGRRSRATAAPPRRRRAAARARRQLRRHALARRRSSASMTSPIWRRRRPVVPGIRIRFSRRWSRTSRI